MCNRDGRGLGDVADPVDVARRCEAAHVAGVVVVHAQMLEVLVEQLLAFDALDDAEDTPADVVVDDLPGSPDQAEDGERAVRFDMEQVSAVALRVAHPLFGGEDLRSGQVLAQLVCGEPRGLICVIGGVDRVAYAGREIGQPRLGRGEGDSHDVPRSATRCADGSALPDRSGVRGWLVAGRGASAVRQKAAGRPR
jgi:hypothetical protein